MAWDQTRDQLIKRALRQIGAIGVGEEPTAAQLEEANDVLNIILNDWGEEGLFRWSREDRYYNITASSEVTGTDSEIYTCILPHTSSSDDRPITGDKYSVYWRKDGSTGGTWNTSTNYTASGIITLDSDIAEVEQVFYRDRETDHFIELYDLDRYNRITKKGEGGNPIIAYFKRGDSSNQLFLYPQPEDTDIVIIVQAKILLDETETNADSLDFKKRWFRALYLTLAAELAPMYGLPLNEIALLEAKAKSVFDKRKLGETDQTFNRLILPNMSDREFDYDGYYGGGYYGH